MTRLPLPRRAQQLPSRPLELAWALVLATALLAGCATDGGPTAAPTDGGATDVLDPGDPAVGTPCLSSDDCEGQVCDKRFGGCVECFGDMHCGDGEVCVTTRCQPQTPCSEGCAPQLCGPDGLCVECLVDTDCPDSAPACLDHVCRPAMPSCASFDDCAALGAVCDEATSECVSCQDESQCGDFEQCQSGECVPDPCIASESFCLSDTVVGTCRADGQGVDQSPCPGGQTCFGGKCLDAECEPGTTTCERYERLTCTPDGQLIRNACGVGEECVGDACQPMRHRVLVVFDTSGSMDWYPGTTTWPPMCGSGEGDDTEGCYQPYPVCEPEGGAFTKLGLSKQVFHDFFTSVEEQDREDVIFGLQRFPQTATLNSPTCSGGYFTGSTELTGDTNQPSVPLVAGTWFDQNLHEVLLVPFPETNKDSNVNALAEWMDFSEWAVETGEDCAGPEDCENGVCLGSGGFKKCSTFANPELRAHGWTPLGKSLFYAGEYMRRSVVIDGKPCGSDTDCASPGYYCGEGGRCFDPLRECRLNVVLLFTDGGETQYPFTNDFFNPQVQAKRMRFGLGCSSDADCSEVDYCVDDTDQLEWFGCHPTRCVMDPATPGQGYCANDPIEGDPAAPVTIKVPGYDRVRDYNGNPITIVTSVIDASVTDPEQGDDTLNGNRLIALNGGGLHVIASVEDAPDFLNALKKTTDFKQLFTECALAGAQQ